MNNLNITAKENRTHCNLPGYVFFIIIALFFTSASINAQRVGIAARDSLFNKFSYQAAAASNLFYVVRYNGKNLIDLHNVKIIRRISNNVAIVQVDDEKITLSVNAGIEKISPANNRWKLSPSLEGKEAELLNQKINTYLFTITSNNINALLKTMSQKKAAFTIISVFNDAQSAVIKCNADTLFQVFLAEEGLLFVDLYVAPRPDVIINGYNRSISNINLIDYYLPAANGSGITVGIKERSMDATDLDLQKRVQSSILASSEKDFHATTVSTLVGGAGNSFYSGKGVASRCNFFPSSFTNLFPDSTNLLKQKNVTVQNHSYGTQVQSYYGAEAAGYDFQTVQNNSLLHVFSSGNRGTEAATSGTFANLPGFSNVTGNFKMAKNIITVAAVDTGGNIAPFSSTGPLYDGRLGPQITALGPNGTSEAAAIISGAAAVLQQVYKDSNEQVVPPASLIKAVLYNSCDDIGNKGIDYRSGFGLLNMYTSLNCLQRKKYDGNELQQSQVWLKNIAVPPRAVNLKITLNWTDTAASVNDNKALVNDLDLEVVELKSGMIYKPWCLNLFPNIDSLNSLPQRKRDSLNTSEQVSIELPPSGTYQVRVTGTQILTIGKQSFHIAYSWDTLNTLRFTNPVQLEDINQTENSNLNIKWRTSVTDTNAAASLLVTFDNQHSWQLISNDIKISHQSFNWQLPDTTATAQFRMNCSFDNFYSVPFVIAPVSRINVDYLCGESLRLSWPKNTLANAYQLYALGDSAFIKPITIVSDTFIVLSRKSHPENIYAVQPLLKNGLQTSRSIAVDVRNQGVDCFYKTLQAKTTGDSIELMLELSFSNAADSIVFEKVTATGTLIKALTKFHIVANKFTYTSFDNSPGNGFNYYRAKLWKSGSLVYSEISYVLHNGKKVVLMYPNPVARGHAINFLIKENVGESVLQVSDITGRAIGNYIANSSGSISTRAWPSGIYLYRMVSTNGKMIANGKFIVE